MPNKNRDGFIPALKFNWLTPIYDPLIRWTLPEQKLKRHLVSHARIRPGQQVLDLGCGTGTLTLLVKHAHPDAKVWGVDADRKVIAIAKQKALDAKADVFFLKEMASRLTLPPNSVDRIVSSLFFHHLKRQGKVDVLKEAHRVLRPGGEVHILDWGRPQNPAMRAAFLLVQLLDGFETTADSVSGALPGLLRAAGFGAVKEGPRHMTVFGTMALYEARKPD